MQTGGLTYREGNSKDFQQLKNLGIKAYSAYKNILSPENWLIFHAALNDEEKLMDLLNISRCFVCAQNKRIIGMAYIIPRGNPWDVFPSEWSYIRMVGVDPEWQGKGIAKHAYKTMCRFCKDKR